LGRYLLEYNLPKNIWVRLRNGGHGPRCTKCGRFLGVGDPVVARGRNNVSSQPYGRKLYHRACALEVAII